ncbi:MAG: 30S ribosomal protein S9 [bacterium]|nr:30S ribosomal protein S9 [bacterium]
MAEDNKTEKNLQLQKKNQNKDYIATVGRRREAVARVRLYKNIKEGLMFGGFPVKKGEILVNKMPIEKYFSGEVAKVLYIQPFQITNTLGKFATTIVVSGGGKKGQLMASIHAISRALSLFDTDKLRKILKKKGLLTRDSRIRERRKVGMGGKARRKKQSPKR